MSRLTEWKNGELLVKEEERLLNANGVITKDEMYKIMRHLAEKLADYEDKEEQGLLIELPCKVGDTVWSLDNYCNDCHEYDDYCHRGCKNPKYRLQEHTVRRIEITEDVVYLCSFDRHEMYGKLGETVFLTRSEAEEALAQKEGE